MPRHHQVPQFYLRNFQIPEQPGLIFSYKRGHEPRALSIRIVGQENDYYELKRDDPTVDKRGVDNFLGVAENKSANAIRKLIATPVVPITAEEKGYLTWFIALLAARTPFAREAIASLQIALFNRDLKKTLRDDDEYKKLFSDSPNVESDALDKGRQALLNGDLEVVFERGGETEDVLMASQLQFASGLVDLIQEKYWNLIETNNSQPFLTSDNPVVVMPTHRHAPNTTFGYADGNILVPLSRKRAFLFTNEPWARKIISVFESKMIEFQFYIVTQCETSVFSHIKSEEFQRILNSTEEGKIHTVYLPEDSPNPVG
jgi:hypothetical protein